MISSKKDLKEYILLDEKNNSFGKRRFFNPVRKYLIVLRKTEYHINRKHRILSLWYRFVLRHLSNKYLTYIPCNCCQPGLSIPHLGSIYINSSAKIGKNCSVHEMVTIGATSGQVEAPIIGDNVFIGSGAKVIGNISIANDVAIGAGAVVVNNIEESGTTWAGVPAKKISNHNSHCHLDVYRKVENKL